MSTKSSIFDCMNHIGNFKKFIIEVIERGESHKRWDTGWGIISNEISFQEESKYI